MADSQLFESSFSLTNVNAQKYDRVARLTATSTSNTTFITLDVNTDLFPIAVGDRVHIMLASTLQLDGTKDDGKGWRDVGKGEPSLADMYDYVCHGKIYRFEEGGDEGDEVM
jgi:DNA-directed RNA polymerase I, II, and III subunit RPABC3